MTINSPVLTEVNVAIAPLVEVAKVYADKCVEVKRENPTLPAVLNYHRQLLNQGKTPTQINAIIDEMVITEEGVDGNARNMIATIEKKSFDQSELRNNLKQATDLLSASPEVQLEAVEMVRDVCRGELAKSKYAGTLDINPNTEGLQRMVGYCDAARNGIEVKDVKSEK